MFSIQEKVSIRTYRLRINGTCVRYTNKTNFAIPCKTYYKINLICKFNTSPSREVILPQLSPRIPLRQLGLKITEYVTFGLK